MSGITVMDQQTGAFSTVQGEVIEDFYRNGKCGCACRVNGETVYYVALTSNGHLNAVPLETIEAVDAAIAAYWVDRTMPGFTPTPDESDALPAPRPTAPVTLAQIARSLPTYDETTCWECGTAIVAGDGVLDEPQGWAHRSCVGA